jgi:hypothetical protein
MTYSLDLEGYRALVTDGLDYGHGIRDGGTDRLATKCSRFGQSASR